MHLETLAVHAGRGIDPATGAVTPPIHLSTTFERSPTGTYPLGYSYSREENPNRNDLEACLAALEGGKESLAFASGLAVLTAVIQGLEPNDHVVAGDDVYYGLRIVVHQVFGKWPFDVTYADMADLAALKAAIRPTTRLIWFETPSNPLMKLADLRAVAAISRQANAISICDATFTSPIVQRPLDCGVDMVMHSTTKYIGGHSDVVGGALITRHDNYLFERARKSQKYGGAVPSPFDCWLTLRGVSTLPCRMRAHCENAALLAAYLEAHPVVESVHYPGLASHAQHGLATAQMTGFGGMLSFQLKGGRDKAMAVAAAVRLITRATSLGGTHTLIEHRASVEGPQTKTPQNLLRLSVGLENSEDLIRDLEQALRAG